MMAQVPELGEVAANLVLNKVRTGDVRPHAAASVLEPEISDLQQQQQQQ